MLDLIYFNVFNGWREEQEQHEQEGRMRYLRWAMGWAEMALGLPLSPENEGD